MNVAALYVDPKGVYAGLEGVDVWGEERDARLYAGPWPVVAHPPCEAWSAWRSAWRERTTGRRVGDDGGCFASALAAVRRFGGVLEHPAHSLAWLAHDLPAPGGTHWLAGLGVDGWVCEVDQALFGHRARKRTWLYCAGIEAPPVLTLARASVWERRCDFMSQPERRRTPIPFRDALLALASNAQGAPLVLA